MKILILTQPLLNNYGCLLQNYAMQRVLERLGNQSVTFDVLLPSNLWRCIFSCVKTVVLFFIPGKRRSFAKFVKPPRRKPLSSEFVFTRLNTIGPGFKYTKKIIRQNKIDAVLVGSDQVWRPKYNHYIEDMFLRFTKGLPIRRIAYAASFGVDNWEYSPKQSCECSKLAKKFDAISVREESGVKLCKEHLGFDATLVLDPTLLLTKEDYLSICEAVPICNENYLAVYVLNENKDVVAAYEKEAKELGLVVKKFYADSKSTLSVPEWLAMFRDASYVVTDSFHGTVFSIIFGKEFRCIYNKSRGATRFESLLNLYNSGKLEKMREFSLNWLKNVLEN